jgi:hypothetical protein
VRREDAPFPGSLKLLGRTSHFLRPPQEWLASFCLLFETDAMRLPLILGTWAVAAGSVNINSSFIHSFIHYCVSKARDL